MEDKQLETRERPHRPWIAWTLVALGAIERIVGWGGSIDFVLTRWNEPAWVATVLNAVLAYSNLIGLALLLGGIALLIRHERKRNDALYGPLKEEWENAPDLVAAYEAATTVAAAPIPEITPTSHKGKPLVRLTDPERNRVSAALLAIGDYLKHDFAEFLRPFQEMRNAEEIMKLRGGAGYHELVEAPRPTMRQFIDSFTTAMEPYRDEMLILGLSVDGIKTKAADPLWRAVREVSNVSQMLPDGACNSEPLKLPLRQLGEAVEAVQQEVYNVENDVKRWRLKISRGEL